MLANHQNLVAKYGDFKRKKAKNLPKSSKKICGFCNVLSRNLAIFFFEKFQKLPLTVLLGTFLKSKMMKIHHKRIHIMWYDRDVYLFIY
jgi:hypothetical protein